MRDLRASVNFFASAWQQRPLDPLGFTFWSLVPSARSRLAECSEVACCCFPMKLQQIVGCQDLLSIRMLCDVQACWAFSLFQVCDSHWEPLFLNCLDPFRIYIVSLDIISSPGAPAWTGNFAAILCGECSKASQNKGGHRDVRLKLQPSKAI